MRRDTYAGGFADLHNPQQWALDHVRSTTTRGAYEELVQRMMDALDFMRTIHAEVRRRRARWRALPWVPRWLTDPSVSVLWPVL